VPTSLEKIRFDKRLIFLTAGPTDGLNDTAATTPKLFQVIEKNFFFIRKQTLTFSP
jgi:hypothetical protein